MTWAKRAARRSAWLATVAALAGLCFNLVSVATGQSVWEESLLLPCSVLISSFQMTRQNDNARQDVLHTITSGMLTVAALIFLGMRVAG